MTLTYRTLFGSLLVSFALSSPCLAQEELAAGKAEYQLACAICHGDNGKGDGEMLRYLTIKPSDLTQLTKSNHGEFPFLRVFQTIDGRNVVKTHGEGPMPIWGDRYKVESGAAGQEPYKSYQSELYTRGRILELTFYLQSLQE